MLFSQSGIIALLETTVTAKLLSHMARLPAARPLFAVAFMFLVLSSSSSSSYSCPSDPSSVSKYRVTVNANHSLQEVARMISNHTLITINTSWVIISSPVEFSHLSEVTLDGQGATITCSSAEGGLVFHNMQQLCLTNFTLSNCSMWSSTSESKNLLPTTPSRAAALIIAGTNVTILHVQVTNNTGTGLAILDTTGKIAIKESLFAYNRVNGCQSDWGGGLHVQLSGKYLNTSRQAQQRKGNLSTVCIITHCSFTGNGAYKPEDSSKEQEEKGGEGRGGEGRGGEGRGGEGEGRGGGGLAVYLTDTAVGNHIYINQSTFEGNLAVNNGGGLSILLSGKITNNLVAIIGSNFSSNRCQSCRGGGASVTWNSTGGHNQSHNMVCVITCTFQHNQARFGGGVAVLTTKGNHHVTTNTLNFTNTSWEANMALYGAAVDISPALSYHSATCNQPTFTFSGCKIVENQVTMESDHAGSGTMRISEHDVTFFQSMKFTNNNGSAFILRNGVLTIKSGCKLHFSENKGSVGSAMLLQQSSWVSIEGDSGTIEMLFHNNRALYNGGAIAVYTDNMQENSFSQACFLQCRNNQQIKLHFRGNMAGVDNHTLVSHNSSFPKRLSSDGSGFGDIIYATTLKPCLRECRCNKQPMTENDFEYFNYTCNNCIVTVNANKRTDEQYAHRASSRASSLSLPGDGPINLIPGKDTHLNISAYDDLKQLIRTSYWATVTEGSDRITLDSQYGQLSNTSIKVYGQPGSSGTVRLEAYGVLGLIKFMKIEMDYCPPGYILDEWMENLVCVCGVNSVTKQRYFASILYCNKFDFRAKLAAGMWAGYISHDNITNTSYKNFRMVTCPLGYCNTTESVFLPSQASSEELDRFICVDSRKGILCADCIENTTTSFHSKTFKCVDRMLCSWGLVFYTLTEVLPLTLLFLAITCFSIDFSKGGLSSFILFAQIQPLLIFSKANSQVFRDSSLLTFFYNTYNLIYGVFNLEFFKIEPLAFCLWDGANPLDMLAIQYVSTLYALLLVIGLVIVFNHCSCCRCCYRLMIWRRRKGFSASMVHGITAFLTLCYAQCVTVTIKILTTSYVQGYGGRTGETWVYYYARVKYFSGQHLIYAIPAFVFLVTFVIIPPLLLMAYPVCYQVMSLCHVSETRVGLGLTRWIEKLKPLLDAFQSCFKDRFRFTAGLYFLYRAVVPAVYVAVDNTLSFYITLEILFTIALLFHTIAQPYHKTRNNIYHALVVADLGLITSLYIYNYTVSQQEIADHDREILVTSIVMILIYLPLIGALGYLIITCGRRLWPSTLKKLKVLKRRSAIRGRNIEDDGELPARLLEEESINSCDYSSWE